VSAEAWTGASDPERPAPPANLRPRRPILYSLLALLLVAGVVPLAVFGLEMTRFNREQLKLQQDEYQLTLAESLAREVGGLLEARRAEVEALARTLQTALGLSGEQELLEMLRRDDILAKELSKHPDVVKVVYLSEGGEGWKASRTSYHEEREATAESALVQRAFVEAMKGEPYMSSSVAIAGASARSVVLAFPVWNGARVRGVVSALVSLEGLENTLTSGGQKLYTVYVADAMGAVVAHSTGGPSASDAVSSPLIAAFLQNGGIRTMPFAVENEGKERRRLGAYATVAEVGWGAFVEVDEDHAYHAVALMTKFTWLSSLLSVLLAAVLGTVFASRLARPLRDLAAGALRIARGQFGERLTVSSANEIGQVAESFNFMAWEIEDQIVKLEQAAAENKELFLSTVKMLAEAIDEKDPYTRGHSERVTRYSVAIAKALGYPPEDVEPVQIAALLHDVGKIGIDDRILRKPTMLTDEEFEVMKQHPEKGAHIMSAVKQLERITPMMRGHHEKYDGTGYPRGLKGDEIPVGAQIISVADTFDAMTTDRPYQKGMDPEFVLGKLKGWVGTRFREDVVAAFERAVRAGDITVRRPQMPQVSSASPTAVTSS